MLKLLTSPLARKLLLYGSAIALVALAAFSAYTWLRGPKVEIVIRDNTKTVYVDKPVIVDHDIIKYVTDKAEVQKILDENKKLGNQVTVLNETIAELIAKGYGEVKVIYKDKDFKFILSDFRLNGEVSGSTEPGRVPVFSYQLHQKFEAVTAVGKDKDGRPFTNTKLFEVTPVGNNPLTITKQTTVAATPGSPSWSFAPTVQGGVGVTQDGLNGVAGVQLFKRGTTKAAEDCTLSVATPAVIFDAKKVELGILPVSVNLGRLPRQPFRDIWVSPYIGLNGKVGVMVTASF